MNDADDTGIPTCFGAGIEVDDDVDARFRLPQSACGFSVIGNCNLFWPVGCRSDIFVVARAEIFP
ncbi:hypothetical protein EET67_03640 [Pseudaminobacter arsenicus]|uniref:Uncharacterized protein n=1 Tax=Borborobacter arsenicus TaxID=1851146 RepID=A0A432VAY3_9HYPH|nr:hypothetical protein [Pseudaminobacter arsenicus]RUM99266.1 hypothetical protein EET67_03640 [Pseudaminobacter arsenicus]